MLSNFSPVQLFAALWTVTRQASLAMELCRQEYWSWLLIPISLMSESQIGVEATAPEKGIFQSRPAPG